MPKIKKDCLICNRISLIKKGENPYFVIELKSSYVVLGDNQFYKGYTLVLSKIHSSELHLLPKSSKQTLLKEVSVIGEAVYKTFHPKKLNYELLGNEAEHVHWHIFPRYKNDPNPTMPVWIVDKSIRNSEKSIPTKGKLKEYKKRLLLTIKNIYQNNIS
ncbi:MAG: hypothetical protein AUJ85_04630 [Elusimicrobia bacterium CG1_02_37_114]|nr:HIT family protein [Candidatus Roizmanbacteria bacterium]OIO74853.1 MAG: hypothetical protein AUJ85_04630 [Elusimicrobia bacterium CG1_02_37_114]